MNLDELKDKFKEYFSWNDIEFGMFSVDVEKTSAHNSGENDKILKALLIYGDKVKKINFADFIRNSKKWIGQVTRQEKESFYSNPNIEYIVESLLDSMEYSLQKLIGNQELTTRFNRKNYKRVITSKYSYEDLNQKLNSFVISINGAIEISTDKREQFFDQLSQMISMADIDIIRMYLINYFWDFKKWTDDILTPLTANFENGIVIQTKNDMARSLHTVKEEMIKASANVGVKL
jgi:hypothetical protein